MWSPARVRATLVLLAVLGLVVVACYDIKPPPVPSAERVPTIVGQIVAVLPNGRFELATDDVIDIRDQAYGGGTRTRLGRDTGSPPDTDGSPGGLILAGEDSLGRFFAATRPPEEGCFRIFGSGYLQLDRNRVLLSSGLVLQLKPGFTVENDRPTIATEWLFEADTICLDASGNVTSIHQEGFGA